MSSSCCSNIKSSKISINSFLRRNDHKLSITQRKKSRYPTGGYKARIRFMKTLLVLQPVLSRMRTPTALKGAIHVIIN